MTWHIKKVHIKVYMKVLSIESLLASLKDSIITLHSSCWTFKRRLGHVLSLKQCLAKCCLRIISALLFFNAFRY